MQLRILMISILFAMSISGCAGGTAQVRYPPELTINKIHLQDKVGLHIIQDSREFMDQRWGISYSVGPLLVVAAQKHFYTSFAECRVLHHFPPRSDQARGLDAIVVIGKPESTLQRLSTFGYLARLALPISVYAPDGKTLLNTYESDAQVTFEMGAINPMTNIEISHQAMQAVVNGATLNFLRQYSGTEPPVMTSSAATGTTQANSTAKGADLHRPASGNPNTAVTTGSAAAPGARQPAGGIYALEQGITFNVLDKVVFDDQTGRITLIGHYDAAYEGRRIPYLQHLATLLESPKPEFSLEWTNKSESGIEALFGRLDSVGEMRRVIEGWKHWIDADGKITAQGRIMLPLFGIKPTEHGEKPGYLGATVKLIKPQSYGQKLPITKIESNSPAQRAGLRIGDEIIFIGNQQPYHPTEVVKFIRRQGAGAKTRIRVKRAGVGEKDIHVTLGTGSGDPWDDLSRYDMIIQIFKAADMQDVSWILFEFQRLQNLVETPVANTILWDVITSTGNYNKVRQMQKQVQAGRLTRDQYVEILYRIIFEGTDRKLKSTHLASTYQRALRQGYHRDDAFDVAYTSLYQQISPLFQTALQRVLKTQDEIVMPLSIVKSTLGMTPMVTPTYFGVDRRSQLARVMFEADYLCKYAIDMPELKDRVPRYQTQYAYYRNYGGRHRTGGNGSLHAYRLWISIDRMELAQSPQGGTLEIRDAGMRFNVRDLGQGPASSRHGGYERLLTSLYDDLAREFHVLHELREAAKLSAASQWIKAKSPAFRLPADGRRRWQGPEKLPGLINLIWSPNHVRVEMAAMGGVSFVPDIGPLEAKVPVLGYPVATESAVVELKSVYATPRSLKIENTDLGRRLRRKAGGPLPSPVLRPAGALVRATKGEKTLQALTVHSANTSRCDAGQSIVLSRKLEKARRKAKMLKAVEDSINYINGYTHEGQKEFAAVNAKLNQARDEFIETTVDILTQGVSNAYDGLDKSYYVKDLETFKQGIGTMNDARDFIGSLKSKISNLELAYRTATADDIASRNQAVRDLLELTKELMSDANFRGNDALSRAFRTAAKTFNQVNRYKDVLSLGMNLIDLGEGMIRLKTADQLTEQNFQTLTDKLLSRQRELSNQLDDAINDPAVQDWLLHKSNTNC